MNKVLKVISNIVLIILIIILSLYVLLRFTNKICIYEVMSGSMETGIHKGDYLIVLKEDNYKKDDVITYMKDGYYITHRIVEINGNKVITKGDANNSKDEEISKEDIVGKYIFKHKIINIIIDYKYLFIALILILFIISSTLNSNKNQNNNEEEENESNKG